MCTTVQVKGGHYLIFKNEGEWCRYDVYAWGYYENAKLQAEHLSNLFTEVQLHSVHPTTKGTEVEKF